MLERERQHLIVKVVNGDSFASVSELMDLLSASIATIRRDINVAIVAEEEQLRQSA